ncbi:hypothetical protein GCM10008101_00450 [Lysobacter xinjiangensis]|uniref:Uncharacterized protein n=1 Tax=Cognatilysobacter xinjiangensis TaxID=546892 RepID=A0ABQ3BMK2_9GAMM|nr:hypothetical protein GCM10008101_00450 [Lysobacter xinjiangensis]
MPVSAGAGRSAMNTFSPLCRPTPVARIVFFRVRWRSMVGAGLVEPVEKLARARLNLNGKAAAPRTPEGHWPEAS